MTPPSPTVEPIDPDLDLVGASESSEPVEPAALPVAINCLECRSVTYHAHLLYPQLCQPCGTYVSQLEKMDQPERAVEMFWVVCARATRRSPYYP